MTKTSPKKIQQLTIPEDYAHERLDQVLAKLLPNYSRTQLQDWLQSGNILVNGVSVKSKLRVKGGEQITIDAIEKTQSQWEAEPIELTIIYEDESLMIIDKPVGLVVHPGAGNANHTLLNALLYHHPDLQTLPRAGILHRLDKDTSGLLVVAKTSQALKHLSQQLKKRTLVREYQAIVYGSMISGGVVEAPIGRHPLQRKRMAVVETGKYAETHYRVTEKYRYLTRLKLRLETGRTHQIRVHMAHIRHPIVGDVTYGGRVQLGKGMTQELIQGLRDFKRQALHAFALGLTHPVTDEFMRWESELPKDMKELIRLLRHDEENSDK